MQSAIKYYRKTKLSCYYMYLAMSSVYSLPPLLFMIFRDMYNVSYTLLGTLVVINFCTQLGVDLVFSFFTKYFNIHKTIRAMPLITAAGLLIYAITPSLFPQHAYLGLAIGTFIFSVAAGLNEVLVSPLVAALPSENPDRDMSMLHSLYAWGVMTVVLISTAFLKIFGNHNWMYLTVFWAVLPIIASIIFHIVPLPDMDMTHSPENKSTASKRAFGLTLCTLCIFLGSAAENAMTNWISVYIESALHIPKALGDILGLALFAILLGLVRVAYAKYGKNISKVLLYSMMGAVVCYLVASLSPAPIVSMIACVFTGLCTSMLWPGTLILMEEKFPAPGIAAYALMAAGGDLGASVAPQMLGAIVDSVSISQWGINYAAMLSISPEQFGMKFGMLIAAIFPLLGTFLLVYMIRYFKKQKA